MHPADVALLIAVGCFGGAALIAMYLIITASAGMRKTTKLPPAESKEEKN